MTIAQKIWSGILGLIVLGTLLLIAVGNHQPSTAAENLFVKQAAAFLNGDVAIDSYGWDSAIYEGETFVPFPPAPAVLLMPVVALLGRGQTNPVAVSILLAGLALWALWRILAQLNVSPGLRFWLMIGFFLGTPFWLALNQSGGVWFFAHVVAVTFLLLALREALGPGRGWLAGIFLAVAMLSRQVTLFASVYLIVLLWQNWPQDDPVPVRQRWLRVIGFLLPVGVAGMGYLWLNAVRFGDPFTTGYGYLQLEGFLLHRVWDHGLFSPAYLFFNLFYLLFQGFHVTFSDPKYLTGMALDPYGTSLLAGSPFVLAAFFAPRSARNWAAWLSVVLMLGLTLFYYNNGWVQLNAQRFTLDFWPVLLVLVAQGMRQQARQGQTRLWQWLIGYAITLNLIALILLEPLNEFLPFWLSL